MKLIQEGQNKLMTGRLPHKFLIFGFLLIVLFVPYKTTIVPEWKLRAVNKNGEPIPHARFRQGWNNYSYDIGGMEFIEGDEDGAVVLPERAFYLPLIY